MPPVNWEEEDRKFRRDVRIICLAVPSFFAFLGYLLAFTVAPGAINMAAGGTICFLLVAGYQTVGMIRRKVLACRR